jgi:hypothetical protein
MGKRSDLKDISGARKLVPRLAGPSTNEGLVIELKHESVAQTGVGELILKKGWGEDERHASGAHIKISRAT